ncbi:MAG: hypothetical protein H6646_15750 [Anaerolineales bacterium]|nr:hypothetical protein [Anaerolineales bacterium]MCB9143719.1 hypothetical protein [Anaerolineales bacterium]
MSLWNTLLQYLRRNLIWLVITPPTGSRSGIPIPSGPAQLTVRAPDLVYGWGGRAVVLDLTAAGRPNCKVQR